MANIKSAQKQNRQRIKRTARNSAQKSEMRSAIKAVRAALAAKDGKGAKKLLGEAVRLLDRGGQKGVIKKRTASRTVSRLNKAISAV